MSSSSEETSISGSDSLEEDIKRKRTKSKKSKHSKRSKSHKKDKKSRKKHKRRRTPSSSEESSSEDEWVSKEDVEKNANKRKSKIDSNNVSSSSSAISSQNQIECKANVKSSNGPEENDWMNFDTMMATYSNDSKRTKRRQEKEEAREKGSIDKLGQSEQELNPYWKNGGTGLPSEDPSSSQTASPNPCSSAAAIVVGDGGLSWLRKAFLRAKDQAKEEGRSLEEIAEERWGSLQKFYEMLEAAEEKAKLSDTSHFRSSSSRHGESSRSRQYSSRRRSPPRFKKPRENSDSDSDNKGSKYSTSKHHDHRSSTHSSRAPHSSSKYRRPDEDFPSRHTSSSFGSASASLDSGSGSRSGWRKPKPRDSEGLESKCGTQRSRTSPSPERKTQNVSGGRNDSLSKHDSRRDTLKDVVKSSEAMEATDEEAAAVEVKALTDKEMNELSAKILKAEMLGNQALVDSLKAKKIEAEKVREDFIKGGGKTQGKETTKKVIKIVLEQGQQGAGPRRKIKEKPGETHKDGERVRYFPDDDRQTLKNMFEQEKRNTVENENALFSRLAGKGIKASEDYDMDDIFTDKASSAKREMKDKERELREIIDEDKVYKKTLEGCSWCFDGNKLQKNLVVAIGEKSFLCLPPYQSLTDGHCLIVPMYHTSCSTELDEDVWEEMQKFRKAVVNMFSENDEDAVIFETAVFLKKHPHMYLECVPMPKETGELAPIYFKKAIQECETEWSQNKKLVDLRNRDVRKAIPKGLPYFSVDFGMDSGFAHVIEDERYFPKNFAQEIVGGMLELDHSLWRKQKQDDFKTQRSKVMEFLKVWGPHDWTKGKAI